MTRMAMRFLPNLMLPILFFSIVILTMTILSTLSANAQQEFRQREFLEQGKPKLPDSHLKVEEVVTGLDTPTTMAFLGPNDILVLEKDKGTIQRIVDGKLAGQPLPDVNVANSVERCMCGIAVAKHDSKTYVFLNYTEINNKDGEDRQGKEPAANRLYRYELVNNKLVNPTLLLDLPAAPGPRHNGGKLLLVLITICTLP